MTNQVRDVVIVGAGVGGLSCGQELQQRGLRPLVLERSRGVGGRCATRRVEGQPVDFGVLFVHGSDREFLAAVRSVPGCTQLPDWPTRRSGMGPPCQPDAFDAAEHRVAFAEGINAFPKHLAQGLEVERTTRVTALRADGDALRVEVSDGRVHRTRTAVLAMPVEEALPLVAPLAVLSDSVLALERLLTMVGTVPCLTVLAGYPPGTPLPDWDVAYPENSQVLQVVSQESRKRALPWPCLVFQAHPRFSQAHQEDPDNAWVEVLLQDAAEQLGPWARTPAWLQVHRWKHARTDRGNELAAPFLTELPGGLRLGVAGEVFSPGGGIQAAWRSGRALARRLAGRTEA